MPLLGQLGGTQLVMLFLVLDRACSVNTSNFPCAGDVWFSLKGTTYQNNSCVALENIGEGDAALLCMTNFTSCCKQPYTGENGPALGKWFFPNGDDVPSAGVSGDFYRDRGKMVVRMHRRKGGEDGIYRCEIPDSTNVTQSIFIGVYSAVSGEWYMYTQLFCLKYH